ncbi:uncharacterized protein EAF01_010865 [Botrytis porri]|uniref:uncharacterized protein n=1 Tax=Botrytis porri TaxID=87229 RepID=UPI0019007A7B|nr:uncharacterized protein EAF01_010865 [Botrytis porri]KAF7889372.1 hypothetical protein EAF01_010865 [Botrytis porri]
MNPSGEKKWPPKAKNRTERFGFGLMGHGFTATHLAEMMCRHARHVYGKYSREDKKSKKVWRRLARIFTEFDDVVNGYAVVVATHEDYQNYNLRVAAFGANIRLMIHSTCRFLQNAMERPTVVDAVNVMASMQFLDALESELIDNRIISRLHDRMVA